MRCVCVPVDLDGQIGVVVAEVPPGILTRSFGGTSGRLPLRWIWWFSPASSRALTYGLSLGPQYGETKRRVHDDDHVRHLPGVLGRMLGPPASSSYNMPHSKVTRAGSPSVAPPRPLLSF